MEEVGGGTTNEHPKHGAVGVETGRECQKWSFIFTRAFESGRAGRSKSATHRQGIIWRTRYRRSVRPCQVPWHHRVCVPVGGLLRRNKDITHAGVHVMHCCSCVCRALNDTICRQMHRGKYLAIHIPALGPLPLYFETSALSRTIPPIYPKQLKICVSTEPRRPSRRHHHHQHEHHTAAATAVCLFAVLHAWLCRVHKSIRDPLSCVLQTAFIAAAIRSCSRYVRATRDGR